jgi:hypothetical protein
MVKRAGMSERPDALLPILNTPMKYGYFFARVLTVEIDSPVSGYYCIRKYAKYVIFIYFLSAFCVN